MSSEEILQALLLKNRETEIGKKWNFDKITTIEEFRKNVPLTIYDDYKPYIDRMVENGEQNLVTADIVTQFSVSSGTTGTAKYIPGVFKIPSLDLIMPSGDTKVLHLVNIPDKKSYTPFGTPIQGISVRVIQLLIKECPNNYIVPIEACFISPLSVALYVQMVWGLKEACLTEISSVFIPVVIGAVMTMKSRWTDMLHDIRYGKISSSLPLSDEKRRALEKLLGGADPARADVLQSIFEQVEHSHFKDMLSLIWPQLKVIKCLCSGNMACYVPTLNYYCGPSVHISSYWYGCTEIDIIGIPAKPLEETSLFRLAPNNFYEFIPLEKSHEDSPCTLLVGEVEEGEVYELIVTSSSGFCRYRFGDYIKIMNQGLEHGPLFDFYGREKMTLKLDGHSLFEAHIEKAMTSLTCKTSSRVDYTVSVDDGTYCGYKVWIECVDIIKDGLEEVLDESLQQVDLKYKVDRSNGRIDPLKVAFLNFGTFAKILELMKSRTLNAEAQLKIPRMVLLPEMQEILKQNEI